MAFDENYIVAMMYQMFRDTGKRVNVLWGWKLHLYILKILLQD